MRGAGAHVGVYRGCVAVGILYYVVGNQSEGDLKGTNAIIGADSGF